MRTIKVIKYAFYLALFSIVGAVLSVLGFKNKEYSNYTSDNNFIDPGVANADVPVGCSACVGDDGGTDGSGGDSCGGDGSG